MRKNYLPTTPRITELESMRTEEEPSRNKATFLSGNFWSCRGKTIWGSGNSFPLFSIIIVEVPTFVWVFLQRVWQDMLLLPSALQCCVSLRHCWCHRATSAGRLELRQVSQSCFESAAHTGWSGALPLQILLLQGNCTSSWIVLTP